jgi:hypothetical protein
VIGPSQQKKRCYRILPPAEGRTKMHLAVIAQLLLKFSVSLREILYVTTLKYTWRANKLQISHPSFSESQYRNRSSWTYVIN